MNIKTNDIKPILKRFNISMPEFRKKLHTLVTATERAKTKMKDFGINYGYWRKK